MIVLAKAWAGYDLYQHSDWLLYSTLGSVAIALIVVYFKKIPQPAIAGSAIVPERTERNRISSRYVTSTLAIFGNRNKFPKQ